MAKVTASIGHPDLCWALLTQKEDATLTTKSGAMAIFSTEKKATGVNEKHLRGKYIVKPYEWDELVAQFGKYYETVVLDHEGVPGFYKEIPLKKSADLVVS
ncbi:MAG: hypothetical protein UW92_C0019G0001 [Candidatus Jorgensenbacteria bacterium GW2011_GWA2_45_13]|uniref:Uncharacterized protein n=1 Tax=Candidatus Jorgensenbacteria bacterium GW2011_GWA2_45_13 TaxID=1618662 RepID=A0A0G1L542_9BACT|nr:MAG: hypothetical protein UW92_C0019G0001 [Candidatus Jorgensenbacteria bacterium GW2011_GWA2_45_13]